MMALNIILYIVFICMLILVIGVLYFILLQTRKKNDLLESYNQLLRQDNQLLTRQYEQVILELSNKMLQLASIQDYLVNVRKELMGNVIKTGNLSLFEVKSSFKDIESQINNRSWDEFYERYDEFHGDFIKRIINVCPELTVAEVRLCALIRLNLSSKEICILTNRSLRTVENLRFRIRKKLKVDKTINLSQYLSSV